jgi:hypothetical protein
VIPDQFKEEVRMKKLSGNRPEENSGLPAYHTKDLLLDLLKGKEDIISKEITGLVKADGKPAQVIVRYNKDRLKYHIIIRPIQEDGE